MLDSLTDLQSEKLLELAARLALKGLTTNVIVDTANELLSEGVYDDTLLAIVDSTPSILSNVEPQFRRFLGYASIPVPEYETSIWQLLFFHIRRIAYTEGDPFLPLNDLINDVYYAYPFHEKPGNTLGESHGIQYLIGDYWLFDDLFDREDEIVHNGKTGIQILNEVRESIKRSALEWLDQHEIPIRIRATGHNTPMDRSGGSVDS